MFILIGLVSVSRSLQTKNGFILVEPVADTWYTASVNSSCDES